MSSRLCCPNCHTSLQMDGAAGEQHCPSCGYRYEVRDGIIDFAPDNQFYWGEVSQESMIQVNQDALTDGWFNAFVQDIVGANQRDMARYLLDNVRIAGLFHFYNPQKNQVCVDLGSGWGPISFGLSKYYDTVYSMDGVYERLRFQAIRAEQEGIQNVKILKGSLLKLPLPDNSADTVIVNGLLEWIGLSDEVTPPQELQLNFLKEVRRVLKPDGKLFIGIENRLGAHYWLGSRDHSGLRFTSIMPRWLASRVVQRAKRMADSSFFEGARQSYRTLTYTYWGYNKLLRQAGFLPPDTYWAWPSYNEPHVSGTLDGNSVGFYLGTVEGEMKGNFRRTIIGLVRHLPAPVLGLLMKIFSPHFLILTGKAAPEGGLQEQVLGPQTQKSLLRTTFNTEKDLNADYLVLSRKGMERKVSVTTLHDSAHPNFHLEEEGGSSGRPARVNSIKDVKLVAAWLGNFQRQNNQGESNAEEREAEIQRLVENARQCMSSLSDPLQAYLEAYLIQTGISGIPVVKEHGNFVPQNIFIKPDGSLDVMGWNYSHPSGNPLMDAGAFSLALLQGKQGAQGQLAEFAREHGQSMNLPLRLAPAYYILRVLERDFSNAVINADNYLGYTGWSPRLKSALELAIGELVASGQ